MDTNHVVNLHQSGTSSSSSSSREQSGGAFEGIMRRVSGDRSSGKQVQGIGSPRNAGGARVRFSDFERETRTFDPTGSVQGGRIQILAFYAWHSFVYVSLAFVCLCEFGTHVFM